MPTATPRQAGKVPSDDITWIVCPDCGGRLFKRLPTTTAVDLLAYCKHCKQEKKVNIESLSR